MPNDILSNLIDWAVAGLIGIVTFLLRKIFFFDTKIALLEQQLADRDKHQDEQLSDIKESIQRLEGLMMKQKRS